MNTVKPGQRARFFAFALLALSLLLIGAPIAAAQQAVTARLGPVGKGGAIGTARITATVGGGAILDLEVAGLTPGASYQARLQAGTCATPSASFGVLGPLQADATGRATLSTTGTRVSATGATVALEFVDLADGEHIISTVGQEPVACGAIPRAEGSPSLESEPQFRLGFEALAELIPTVVGRPMEGEHHSASGDSLQRTTTGLMVWRKADNWTAFTDGYITWVNGPSGLQTRLNSERFDWES